MTLKLAGYELKPREQFQQQLMDYAQHGAAKGGLPPAAATPVYADDEGNHFVGAPSEDGVSAVPFVPGSKTEAPDGGLGASGGFLLIADIPSGGEDDGFGEMMSAMMEQMPQQMATDWVGNAAKNLMLGGGPGGMMDAALQTMGVENPLTSGPLGAALGGALQSAGLGPMTGLLPSVQSMLAGGSAEALGSAMGSAALGSLVSATGMGSIPGLGTAASMLGSELGDSLSDVFSDGGLDELGQSISSFLDDPSNVVAGAASNIDPNAIAAGSVDEAANYLASQWQVDDESSAAEQIAHKAVMDHRGEIQQALKEEIMGKPGGGFAGLKNRVTAMFTGVPKGTGQPAVRVGDPDDKGDLSVQGVGNIKFQGKEVSRITDKVGGPMAPAPGKQIVIGEPTVLSAGLPTAFVLSPTEVPSEMVDGAAKILVGGAAVAGLQKANADAAKAASNAGPAGPKGPKSTSTGSGNGGGDGDGSSDKSKAGDSTKGAQQDGQKGTQPDKDESVSSKDEASSGKPSEQAGSPEDSPGTVAMPVREGGLLGGENAEIRSGPQITEHLGGAVEVKDYGSHESYNVLGVETGPMPGPAGCGSDGSGWVPDKIGSVDMTGGCYNHDQAPGWATPGSLSDMIDSNVKLKHDIMKDNPGLGGFIVGNIYSQALDVVAIGTKATEAVGNLFSQSSQSTAPVAPLTPLPTNPTDQQAADWTKENNIPTTGLPLDLQHQIAGGSAPHLP